MDKRQNIQNALDEAWFDLLSEGADSKAVRIASDSRKFGAGLATINVDGSVQVGERTFSDSVEAADFVVTGHACNYLKKEDDPE
jgi:hypothetical protein